MSEGILARIGLPTPVSRIAVGVVAAFVASAVLSIDAASVVLVAVKDGVVQYFDWLFVGVATFSLVVVGILAVHPRGNIRLGPRDSQPEFSRLSWFAMLFSAGLASGLLYWAAAEPILHYQGNPLLVEQGGLPRSPDAVETALRLTVLHWGLHGWAFYVLVALGIAIYSHRYGLPLTFRSALYPLLGPKYIHRWPGLTVDLIALFGTVCGVATSIGISAAGMNATLGSLFGLDVDLPNQYMIVFAVCLLGIVSALSGLARGIRRLSELNVWLSLLLLVGFAVLGPTVYLAGLFVDTTADYVTNVLPTGLWLAANPAQQEWQAEWTIFYWGWWLAWTPFVSLFIARISKGRTLREFVLAVMLVPTFVILVWMTVFGGTALHQEMAQAGAVSDAVGTDYSLGIVAVIENLGSPAITTVLVGIAAFLLFTWLITSLDSATLVICHLLGAEEAPRAKMFWGFALAAVSCALMRVGGVPALQAASIVIGLPLAVLLVLIAAVLLLDLVRGRLGEGNALLGR
ncbi:MAG: BCCT family transporter [Myxococcota bacterium]|nr:BCCT family transporter [Myxococcota bacterium]